MYVWVSVCAQYVWLHSLLLLSLISILWQRDLRINVRQEVVSPGKVRRWNRFRTKFPSSPYEGIDYCCQFKKWNNMLNKEMPIISQSVADHQLLVLYFSCSLVQVSGGADFTDNREKNRMTSRTFGPDLISDTHTISSLLIPLHPLLLLIHLSTCLSQESWLKQCLYHKSKELRVSVVWHEAWVLSSRSWSSFGQQIWSPLIPVFKSFR